MDEEAVSSVLQRGFQETGASGFAAIFLDLRVAFIHHASILPLLYFVFKIETQFLIEVIFHDLTVEQSTETKA